MGRPGALLAVVTMAKEEMFEFAFQRKANLIAQAGALGGHIVSLLLFYDRISFFVRFNDDRPL